MFAHTSYNVAFSLAVVNDATGRSSAVAAPVRAIVSVVMVYNDKNTIDRGMWRPLVSRFLAYSHSTVGMTIHKRNSPPFISFFSGYITPQWKFYGVPVRDAYSTNPRRAHPAAEHLDSGDHRYRGAGRGFLRVHV